MPGVEQAFAVFEGVQGAVNGWSECPRCWGTGLVHGWGAPCSLAAPATTRVRVVPRDFIANPPTEMEVVAFAEEVGEAMVLEDLGYSAAVGKVLWRWIGKSLIEKVLADIVKPG